MVQLTINGFCTFGISIKGIYCLCNKKFCLLVSIFIDDNFLPQPTIIGNHHIILIQINYNKYHSNKYKL